MTNETKLLIRLSAFAATGNQPRLRKLIRGSAFSRVSLKKAVEAMLQLHLFAGFPATIEGLSVLQAKVPRRRFKVAKGSGMQAFRKVYDVNSNVVFRKLQSLHPDLLGWIIHHGYGSVLNRKGLSLVERELCAVAVLAATGWEKQLLAHMIGASNVGASAADIAIAVRMGRATARV